jgi:hypothetical protein
MTRISNKYPALRRAQKWLAEHGDPLPEPGTRPRKPAKDKSRTASHPPIANSHSPVDISHHERRCSICQHPEREAIEEAFLHWHSISQIRTEFKLPERFTVYRHAHAFNLFPRRSRNLRFALGLIIEEAECVRPTTEGIVSAIRAYTSLTDAGEWIEPPAHVIVSSGARLAERSPAEARRISGRRAKALPPARHESPITSHESQVLIPTHTETENDATP